MSAKNALENYYRKQMKKEVVKKPRKNSKPEQKVVNACMSWFKEFGFSMHVVESKAVYSVSASRYLRGQVAPGFLDSAGCTPNGTGCFVEFKSRGRLSTLSDQQREFIKDKALRGAFACVVDGVDRLKLIYQEWNQLLSQGRDAQIAYLLDQIPKKKEIESDLF